MHQNQFLKITWNSRWSAVWAVSASCLYHRCYLKQVVLHKCYLKSFSKPPPTYLKALPTYLGMGEFLKIQFQNNSEGQVIDNWKDAQESPTIERMPKNHQFDRIPCRIRNKFTALHLEILICEYGVT